MFDQQGNVFFAVPQGRQFKTDNIYPVVQDLSEKAFFKAVDEVPVCGGNKSHL